MVSDPPLETRRCRPFHNRPGTTWVANERDGASTNNLYSRIPVASAWRGEVLRDGGFKRMTIDTCFDSSLEVNEIVYTFNDICTTICTAHGTRQMIVAA